MIRKHPISKLDVIGKIHLPPAKAVGDYVDSKLQEKYFIKPPQTEAPDNSVELLAIQNERDYLEMLKMQEDMLESAKRQKIVNTNRIKDMYKIQSDIRDRFVAVNKFIKECQIKQNEAVQKVALEKETQIMLKQSIMQFHKDIKELRTFREDLTKTVKLLEPYETVIQKVVEQSDIYKSVKDCIARCDSLMLTQVEISELQNKKFDSIDGVRTNVMKVTNDAALTVLGMNNDLAELERSYIRAQTECFKWERIMAATKDTIVANELTKDRILDGIHQMYRFLCRRRGVDVELYRFDIDKQIDFIKHEITVLNYVITKCSNDE